MLEQLGASARLHQSSLFSVIYTAIALSLHKLGNLSDLVIGTSASGRTDPAYFDTVGYFTTMVAHRVQFAPEQSLAGLLGEVTRMINDSMAYADVPMETIQQALGMTPAEGLMFDVYVQIHANNALNGALQAPDGRAIRYKQIDPDKSESMFGLQFEIMEDVFDGQRSLRLVVTYRSDRYSGAQVERLCAMISAAFGVLAEVDGGRRALGDVEL
jgi:non-ribosomal peptide synthetase component F